MTRLVRTVGESLAAVASPPAYPYEYRLLAADTVNAVAFPGGRIYTYKGLVDKLHGDRDMLAWVLGHETAHVSLRHSAKRIENQVGVEMLTQVLLGKSDIAKVAGVVSGLAFMDYGRDKELQADAQGLTYSQKAGYDPTAAIGVIKVFQSMSGGKDPSKLELLFMSHPGDNTRIAAVQARCKKMGYKGKYYP
jgi:beta-barrel assembly-enhancing protease